MIKEIECYIVNIFKMPKRNSSRGRAPCAPVLDPPLTVIAFSYYASSNMYRKY